MTRTIIPIVLVAVAIAVFVWYTNPTYQEIQRVRAEVAGYDEALTKSKELQEIRNRLVSKYNTFSPDDVRTLERLLPDHVDNIRLIIDIDNIAARYNLRIRNVALRDEGRGRNERSAVALGSSGDPVGVVELGFSISATYADFLRFLKDLEQSLRIVDVTGISFSVGQGDLNDYSVSIRTYWLR